MECATVRERRLPRPSRELFTRTLDPLVKCALRVSIETLTIDAHARGHDQAPDGPLRQLFHQGRGAEPVDARVLRDLVHALPDAYRRGEVDDRVYSHEGAAKRRDVAHVPGSELDAVIQICRSL